MSSRQLDEADGGFELALSRGIVLLDNAYDWGNGYKIMTLRRITGYPGEVWTTLWEAASAPHNASYACDLLQSAPCRGVRPCCFELDT